MDPKSKSSVSVILKNLQKLHVAMALHAAETQAVRAALEAVCRKLGPIEIDGEAVDQWIHLQVEKTKEDFFVSLENSDPEMAAMLQAWADQGEGKS